MGAKFFFIQVVNIYFLLIKGLLVNVSFEHKALHTIDS